MLTWRLLLSGNFRVADNSLTKLHCRLNSTRLRGVSSIFPRRYTQDTFESLAKRRVRVVAHRLRYLEQFAIIFLQRSNCLVHSPGRQIFEWRFSEQFLESQCKR